MTPAWVQRWMRSAKACEPVAPATRRHPDDVALGVGGATRDERRLDGHPAAMIAEVGAAFGAVELADPLRQRLGQAAQLGAEDALLA